MKGIAAFPHNDDHASDKHCLCLIPSGRIPQRWIAHWTRYGVMGRVVSWFLPGCCLAVWKVTEYVVGPSTKECLVMEAASEVRRPKEKARRPRARNAWSCRVVQAAAIWQDRQRVTPLPTNLGSTKPVGRRGEFSELCVQGEGPEVQVWQKIDRGQKGSNVWSWVEEVNFWQAGTGEEKRE